MLGFGMLAILRQRFVFGIACLVCACLTKFSFALVLPLPLLYILAVYRGSWGNITRYLIYSLGVSGAVLLLAATDPEKYKSQVDIAIGGLLVLAVACLSAGLLNAIPTWWYLGDAVPCLVGAILLILFRPRRRQA